MGRGAQPTSRRGSPKCGVFGQAILGGKGGGVNEMRSAQLDFEYSFDETFQMSCARGFLAMEYYLLILNRSYVIFSYPEGLYGWKFSGPVSTRNPLFFQPFEELARDATIVPGSEAFQEFMEQPGSFFIARAEIASANYDSRRKWGMGPVPHSGKIYVRLTSGKVREFILLGSQDGPSVCAAVLSGAAVGFASSHADEMKLRY